MPIPPVRVGTGKKIKFCCKDLLGDLQKIERMLEGEQYIACLSHIERLEQSNPNRACLMATKTLLLRITGQELEAKKATAEFVEKHPENPLALCDSALIKATDESGREALVALEKAIAASEGAFSGRLYEAISVIVQILLAEGHFLAARALTLFQASIVGQDDPAMELLMRLNAIAECPLGRKGRQGIAAMSRRRALEGRVQRGIQTRRRSTLVGSRSGADPVEQDRPPNRRPCGAIWPN